MQSVIHTQIRFCGKQSIVHRNQSEVDTAKLRMGNQYANLAFHWLEDRFYGTNH